MCHMCGYRGLRRIFGVGVRAKRACGKGAVDSQHGTGVKGIQKMRLSLGPLARFRSLRTIKILKMLCM
jgi:hypothetical protein